MGYIGQEPGLGEAERFVFTATAVTDTVTADDDGVLINYVVGQVSVYLNGVKQVVGTDVICANGSTVVFDSDYAIGDVIEIIALSTFSPADTVPATGGTFTGNVVMDANLTVSGTTTTVDTALVVSDATVINNSGSDVGLKINSTSSGNIMQLQDDSSDVLVVADGGTTTGTFAGPLTGNASTATTAATVTDAAQSAITSVGTLTALTGGTGDFNWDSNTLVVDSSESRVGIGIAAPTSVLHINKTDPVVNIMTGNAVINTDSSLFINIDSDNNSTTRSFNISHNEAGSGGSNILFKVQEDGAVGIGTASPVKGLHINDASDATLILTRNAAAVTVNQGLGAIEFGNVGETVTPKIDSAEIKAHAAGTWSGSDTSSYMTFLTTGAGSTTATERMRIASDGTIGLGGAPGSGSGYITTSEAARVLFTATNSRKLELGTENSTDLVIDTSGNVEVKTGDLIFGTAGKGVVLGATSNTDANTLDDYEEGTWTPTASGTGWTQSAGDSRYVKIGKMVSLYVYLQMGTVTGSGMKISGIPFTPASGSYTTSTGVSAGSTGPSSDYHYRLDSTSNYMYLVNSKSAAIASDEYDSTHQIFTINYEASA